MLVSSKYGFCFYHVPKTGGTSILHALAPYLDNPKPVKERDKKGWQIKHHVGGMHCTPAQRKPPKGCRPVLACRNPYSRMVSFWSREAPSKPFSEYIATIKPPQADWARGLKKPMVLRFEDLEEDFHWFCSTIGLPQLELSHRNGSTTGVDWREVYDEETALRVREMWAEDFERFGYPRESWQRT